MKTIIARLKPSKSLSARTRDRCPSVIFTDDAGQIAAIPTDTEQPTIPSPDNAITDLVICDDALSRVIDEHAWLTDIHRILAPGGTLRLSLPAEGTLAWLDTMNIYRYIADITKRGDPPNAALPTGWNRHYRREDIPRLLTDADFTDITLTSRNHALCEIQFLSHIVWRNWIKRERTAELGLFHRFGMRDPRAKSSMLRTTWSISARKPH